MVPDLRRFKTRCDMLPCRTVTNYGLGFQVCGSDAPQAPHQWTSDDVQVGVSMLPSSHLKSLTSDENCCIGSAVRCDN